MFAKVISKYSGRIFLKFSEYGIIGLKNGLIAPTIKVKLIFCLKKIKMDFKSGSCQLGTKKHPKVIKYNMTGIKLLN